MTRTERNNCGRRLHQADSTQKCCGSKDPERINLGEKSDDGRLPRHFERRKRAARSPNGYWNQISLNGDPQWCGAKTIPHARNKTRNKKCGMQWSANCNRRDKRSPNSRNLITDQGGDDHVRSGRDLRNGEQIGIADRSFVLDLDAQPMHFRPAGAGPQHLRIANRGTTETSRSAPVVRTSRRMRPQHQARRACACRTLPPC